MRARTTSTGTRTWSEETGRDGEWPAPRSAGHGYRVAVDLRSPKPEPYLMLGRMCKLLTDCAAGPLL